ncbi:MAG TPA: hypothetical protein VMB05_11225 [Solirubrobacteraceae bacterium]|nr:hypothetical protein [Solirubrobacteraceae bacterium]
MLSTGEVYRETGSDYFTRLDTPTSTPDASRNSNASGAPSRSRRQPPDER